jgi:hypothetical protein
MVGFMKEAMLKFATRVKGLERHSQMLRILVQSSISLRTMSIPYTGWDRRGARDKRQGYLDILLTLFIPNEKGGMEYIPHTRILNEVMLKNDVDHEHQRQRPRDLYQTIKHSESRLKVLPTQDAEKAQKNELVYD